MKRSRDTNDDQPGDACHDLRVDGGGDGRVGGGAPSRRAVGGVGPWGRPAVATLPKPPRWAASAIRRADLRDVVPVRRIRTAAALSAMGFMAACTSAVGDGRPPAAGAAAVVLKHEAFGQCPLNMPHPSVHWVDSRAQWSRLLADARMLPPPYDASETDFTRHAIVLIAMPTTPTSSTAALVGAEPVRWHVADRRLDVTVRGNATASAPDTARATVVGTPCVIVWVQALADVRQVVARTADGREIARSTR